MIDKLTLAAADFIPIDRPVFLFTIPLAVYVPNSFADTLSDSNACLGKQMAKIVAVHSFRGGTGKSNTTANLAMAIAASGQCVAITDTDIQSPGIHVLFGLEPYHWLPG